jgi:hypothetical protein
MVLETLLNGGSTGTYRWGQTLEEVTVHLPLDGLRARDLVVDMQRARLRVAPKRSDGALLEGCLSQPIIVDDSTWMIEDGSLVLRLTKDNMRAENTGPSTEWWNGIFAGEHTLDTAAVSVDDYAKPDMLRPEQRAEMLEAQGHQGAALAQKDRAAQTEAALPQAQREKLESLRAAFPDIPIEWGDTGVGQGPAGPAGGT